MYHVRQFPHCGLSMPARTFEDSSEARADAADLIRRRRRQGFKVALIARGKQWEVLEPEGCALVPDACGLISIRREDFACNECGCNHGTLDAARECCAVDEQREAWQDEQRDLDEEAHNAELLREE